MAIVTLVSGGMDSTLMNLLALEEGLDVLPLFINYGQLGLKREWSSCLRIHEECGLPKPARMDLQGYGRLVPSGITNRTMQINEDAFLPGRNLLLLLSGAAYAYSESVGAVGIGLLSPETSIFPDQTVEFLERAEAMISAAMGRAMAVVAPLIGFSKRDVMGILEERGITGTYSCHSGDKLPCGRCVACHEIQGAEDGE